MKYFSADFIFPVTGTPVKNGVIAVDDAGTIIEIFSENIPEEIKNEIRFFEGALVPGFVNSHCHLELSYLKDKIKRGHKLTEFIREILDIRYNFNREEILSAVEKADSEMYENGIVAVGDISNDDFSFEQKSKSKIYYHTFIEAFDITENRTSEVMHAAINLRNQLMEIAPNNSANSIVPHASYTVSPALFNLINEEARKNNSVISVHNQESAAELELFEMRSGPMFEMFKRMGTELPFIQLGSNSLHQTVSLLPDASKILLVHNTFTSHRDIQWTKNLSQKIYWCFCPVANLYIENRLPFYKYYIEENANCCIGTDSLASNYKLSVLEEMKVIAKNFKLISFDELLKWSTINGAAFLGIENKFGSFDKGKQPGINLIKNFDLENMQLREVSQVERLC